MKSPTKTSNKHIYMKRNYGVMSVQLHDIDKQQGHPSQAGMKAIADQVIEAIKR